MLAYSVARRLREIAIRIALGAQNVDVRRMVMSQVARMTGGGALAGVALPLGMGRLSESMLFGVDGSNPAITVAAVLVASLAAVAAGAIPARRATRGDPVAALK